MSRMSRNKGIKAELELFKLLSADLMLNTPLARNLAQTRRGGGADAERDALPGWAIECKNVAQLSRPSWWRQAITQAEDRGGKTRPVLFYRRRRKPGQAERDAWAAVIEAELMPGTLVAPNDRVPGPPAGVAVSYADAVAIMAAMKLCGGEHGRE